MDPPTLSELKAEDTELAEAQEAEVSRKRQEAQKAAAERGLLELEDVDAGDPTDTARTNETPPHAKSPVLQPVERTDEPSQLPTPLGSDDDEEVVASSDVRKDVSEPSGSDEPS